MDSSLNSPADLHPDAGGNGVGLDSFTFKDKTDISTCSQCTQVTEKTHNLSFSRSNSAVSQASSLSSDSGAESGKSDD
jgi:hypothetical protein